MPGGGCPFADRDQVGSRPREEPRRTAYEKAVWPMLIVWSAGRGGVERTG